MVIMARVSGGKIRDARLGAGMTQAQLARAIQTTEKNIGRWENEQNQPRMESVAAIANATGHELDFFLTASAESDDDEEPSALSLDEYLRSRIRAIVREEIEEAAS